VDTRIDESGKNVFARGIDRFGLRSWLQIVPDPRDGFVFDKNVRAVPRIRRA
jgi:hypothetical protein